MTNLMIDLSEYPLTLPQSTSDSLHMFKRSLTHFAVPQAHSSRNLQKPELRLGDYLIYRIDRLGVLTKGSIAIPVYELIPGGSIAVPSGLVFVRLTEDISFTKLLSHFQDAGYQIEKTLPYSPNAGWLRAKSGSILCSLSGLKRLSEIPRVVNVEPQMLMKSTHK